ncbi:methyl-accepting chemotaxis protein [Alishewanella sp. BS5-314]|uniref:methyl-accepting chemotaxis protein n=1 Tax=Alishewanella sp. BS5-314 TaxID=2755587 RepID=UPI0021BB4DB7|nr:methyl-accepting chemotaxis protein [Alishewanella sp. BS5-314]MCT8125051.1 methyl-accepting chemotaxis protein [Alishewanella sp. BS5-314]
MLNTLLNNFSIGKRIGLGFTIVLLLMAGMIVPVVSYQINSTIHTAEESELRQLAISAEAEIASEGRLAVALSTFYANISSLQQAFADSERDYLTTQLQPAFAVMREKFGAVQFQIHTPPATSWLRVHRPDRFGDDLSGFRQTVVETNRSQRAVQGLEFGAEGLGIRGISPIMLSGRHLGSVEFGMSFGQPFFEQFKTKYGVDLALYLIDSNAFKRFGGSRDGDALVTNTTLQQALQSSQIERVTTANGQFAVLVNPVKDYSGKVIGVLEVSMDRSTYVTALNQARMVTLGVSALAIIIGLVLAYFISQTITVPINSAFNAMHDIAQGEGDLTCRLPQAGNNEIAALAGAFNQFAAKVQTMVQQIRSSVEQISTASEEMSSITDQTSKEVIRQQSETAQVATAMNQMTATVQEVANHAALAASSAQSADKQTQDGRKVMQHTLHTIQTLAQEVENGALVISRLSEESTKIGSVLDVIRGIAEQTNLLALNAAIEAARAGEQGRGFAVVADEVRTLASRTQASTLEIQSMIERLQTGAHDAVKAMQQGQKQAQQGLTQAAQAENALLTISNAVTNINDMNIQIATAAEEQSSVAEEINRNIVNISQSADATAEGAKQTASAGDELAKLAVRLQTLVGQFKV